MNSASAFAQIHHAKLHGAADLLGGQPDARRGVHGLDHFAGKRPERVVEPGDAHSLLAQNWRVKVNNWKWHWSVEAASVRLSSRARK